MQLAKAYAAGLVVVLNVASLAAAVLITYWLWPGQVVGLPYLGLLSARGFDPGPLVPRSPGVVRADCGGHFGSLPRCARAGHP
jgi:hypothetical protein